MTYNTPRSKPILPSGSSKQNPETKIKEPTKRTRKEMEAKEVLIDDCDELPELKMKKGASAFVRIPKKTSSNLKPKSKRSFGSVSN